MRQVIDEYGYDAVLFVDGDILVKADCENFFETVPSDHVAILDEHDLYDPWMLAHYRHEATELLQSEGYDPRSWRIPSPKNAGFYLMPKSHRNLCPPSLPFPLCYRNGTTVEQTWFGLMLEHHRVPIFPLRFPEQHWLWYADQDERAAPRSKVLHFCGLADRSELRYERLVANADADGEAVRARAGTTDTRQLASDFDRHMLLDTAVVPVLKVNDAVVIASHQYGCPSRLFRLIGGSLRRTTRRY